MTPPALTVTELLAVLGIIGGAIGWLVKLHADKRKEAVELGKIDIDSWKLLREQVHLMEQDIVTLRADRDADRERIDGLENERDETLKKFNELKAWVRGLLKQLDAAGFQYDKPRAGLLDTGEHKAVK